MAGTQKGSTKQSVNYPMAQYLLGHMHQEFVIADIERLTGGARASITAGIRRLNGLGWAIAKIDRERYICHSAGAMPNNRGRSSEAAKAIVTPDVITPPALPAPAVSSNGVHPEGVYSLNPGDLLEVVYVSRNGTIMVEDAIGRPFSVRKVVTDG